ncbi:biotin--[acetyl-CoA-carboxylase] ligase [Sphingomonas cavernae]|uniref:biotin--[biotin carboxyl-carrier protein] ligase n=1 Tax=Sphingomonas cavernae TaxID=2320861 RepID=A0A418W802_9SPHN|nr:biotin--[acetyl-CoA-carboxylase] ligase [Sphingomonas cavernae]RJF86122.1 biotin--[acetyl-CoA-carboxylase] ligase [Sphingomonas cavernae]
MIRTVEATASTNADMLGLAAAGEPEGLWLRAETQTSGRGRQGRNWASPRGNLFASTIVRLHPTDPSAATLAFVAAVALAEVTAAWTGRERLSLKWPNDLLLDGAKMSGILLERTGDAVVVGLGVNLAHHPDVPGRVTTSLALYGAPDPALFLEELASAFARWLARWRGEGLAPLREKWLELAHPRGSALVANLPDGTSVEGLFDGLDADGALILRLADGTSRVIHAGDVFLI